MAESRSVLVLVHFAVSAGLALGQSVPPPTATQYLQSASDRYQSTVDVYSDADAAGNHFAARGEIHNTGGLVTPTMDEISASAQCFGITCITAQFTGNGTNWGGWYFQNGVLGSTDRAPSLNWGTQPDAGYDLTGASTLQFWARGALGGETVEFFAFGVGYDPDTGAQIAPYPDSAMKATTGPLVLTTKWTQYTIPLAGLDIHYVLGGFGWVASAQKQANPQQSITFYIDNVQFVKPRPSDPRFVVSYETIKSDNPFDSVERNASYLYDNAVALIALTGAGDVERARTIADSMVYAQSNDRFFSDGRLRNAYQGGDLVLPPGWLPFNKANTVRMPGWYDAGRTTWFEDETQVSSNTGNMAWAMLALLDFYDATHEQKYLTAVDKLGNWVISNTSDTRGNGGFTGGYDGWENGAAAGGSDTCASGVLVNGQCKRGYKATEHNIDLYAAFSRLYKIEGLLGWQRAAQQAKAFFLSMWDPTDGKFWTGTGEDGVTPTTDPIPLDIQVWSIEALGAEAGPYLSALQYIETHHKTALGYGFKQDGGNDCGDNTWFEGTAQVALAYFLTSSSAKWNSILDNIHSVQLPSGSIPATDGTCLNTGFKLNDGQKWEYFPRAHVGATGWLSLAEQGLNPFHSELYAPTPRVQINPTSVNFPGQDVGSTSSSAPVTFTNTGNAPLVITNVSLTGADPTDFSVLPSSGCGIGVNIAAGGTCTLQVVFVPSVAGTRTGIVSLSDNALGSPHSVAVSGSGMDFTLDVSSGKSATQTVSQGQLADYSLSLSPLGGFNETVSLVCRVSSASGLSPLPVCNVPSISKLNGVDAETVSITVSTAASGSSARVQARTQPHRTFAKSHLPYFLALLLPMALINVGRIRGRASRYLWIVVPALVLVTLATLTSCGITVGTPPTRSQVSPQGTYSIVVSGTHDSLSKSTTLILVID